MTAIHPKRTLAPLDLLHLPALRQFVDDLFELAHLLLERVGDVLDAIAADQAGDLAAVGVKLRGFGEEGVEVGLPLAVFLCRDEAQNINGGNYSIDGGWTAG